MPTKVFGTVRQKNFRRKIVITRKSMKLFDTPKFLKDWRDAHEFFRHCEKKNFDKKLWYTLLCINFFDTAKFLKHWRDAHKSFRHCETKKFRWENVIPPSRHRFFQNHNFSETLRGSPRKFLALWDQNLWKQKRDTRFFIHKTFWNQKFSQKQ